MVSITSFVLIPSELNGEAVQESVHSGEFEVCENPEEAEHSENVSLVSDGTLSDITSTEMCERLKNLLQENVDLREKLQRNNKVMDEQLNIIATWRDQIAKTNTKHRAMLEDLVFQNQKLQDEKAELEQKVEELENPTSACQPACLECDSHKVKYSDLEERLVQILSEKEDLAGELKRSKQALEKAEQGSSSPFKFKEPESLQQNSKPSGSIATLITDEESDYAIIIKEDFPTQKQVREDAFKDIGLQCEKLQLQVAELSQSLSEEKLKSEHLEKIVEEKERDLHALQMKCCTEFAFGMTTVTQEREEIRLKLEDLEKVLERKEQELKDLHDAHSELKSESLSIISVYNEDQDQLRSVLKNLEAQTAGILKERDEEKMKREHAENLLKDKERELEDLEIARSEIEGQNTYHASLISTLREDRKKLSSSVQELQSFRERCENLEEQVKTYKTKLDELQLIKFEKEHLIEKLQKEIKSCTEKLKDEQLENELRRKSLIAAEQNFMQLYDEQEQIMKGVMEQKQNIQTQCKQMTSTEATERAAFQNELDSLTAKLLDAEERLHVEEKKVLQLKRETKTLSEDSECIPILKAQVELYKTELENAQQYKIREMALSQQTNDLKDQIKNLQEMIANQPHLQHPGSNSHTKLSGRGRHSRRSSAQPKTSNGSAVDGEEYPCPCCPLIFTDVNAVQNHVERCLAESCE